MTKKLKPIAVELKNVTKRYLVHHEKPTFSEHLIKGSKKEVFTALDHINLTIYKGEKVGIIGPNGAGKTTLLKIISGITTPSGGKIVTKGKIVSLIDLEAGFHPDLSGEENIYLNGMVIGMSKKELSRKIVQIVDFADIGQFIDAPMYTYSSGMKLRLGFAIAVHADPEILILDEGMATGDQWFRTKAQKKLDDFFAKNKTVIVVSHWLDELQSICNRIVWVEHGMVKKNGTTGLLHTYKTQISK